MRTWSNIGVTEMLEEFLKYFELNSDEMRLKNPKVEKPRILIQGIYVHINLQ